MNARGEREAKRIRRYRNVNPCPDSKRYREKHCLRCRAKFPASDTTREWFCEACRKYRDRFDRDTPGRTAVARRVMLIPGGKVRD